MKHILLCGNSIFITGLAASLQGVAGLAVTNTDLGGLGDLRGLDPDVVIVDLNGADAGRAVAHLARPGRLILGVDAARGVLTVLTGPQMAVADTGDLAQLVQRFVSSKTGSGGGY